LNCRTRNFRGRTASCSVTGFIVPRTYITYVCRGRPWPRIAARLFHHGHLHAPDSGLLAVTEPRPFFALARGSGGMHSPLTLTPSPISALGSLRERSESRKSFWCGSPFFSAVDWGRDRPLVALTRFQRERVGSVTFARNLEFKALV
jgi:hypothetical protein